MVSGGTYGTEEIIHGAGYGQGILILLFLPVLWSLPTAFMIGELSSSLPAEGGYYAWVRRGMGNFWGFQEAWLSLAASIFDMAIYPTMFVFYLKQMSPWFGIGNHGICAGLFVVMTCAALNLAGIRVVGLTSLWLFFLLSAPFALVVVLAPFKMGALADPHAAPATTSLGLLGGVLVAMWNYDDPKLDELGIKDRDELMKATYDAEARGALTPRSPLARTRGRRRPAGT